MITKAYLALDNFLVDRANDTVKAWNWTTGRTRADLADILNASGWVMAVSHYTIQNSPGAILMVPLAAMNIYFQHKNFCRIDENDIRAKNGEALIMNPEVSTRSLKLAGGTTVIAGGFFGATGDPLLGVGFGGVGASQYVMRADYLPPRKNVLSRAKDNLAEMVSTYRGPITVPIRS